MIIDRLENKKHIVICKQEYFELMNTTPLSDSRLTFEYNNTTQAFVNGVKVEVYDSYKPNKRIDRLNTLLK